MNYELEGKVILFEGSTGEALLTSQELEQRAKRLAERLRQLGVDPNELG